MNVNDVYEALVAGKKVWRKLTEIEAKTVTFVISDDGGKNWSAPLRTPVESVKQNFGKLLGPKTAPEKPKAVKATKPEKAESDIPDMSSLIEKVVRKVVKEELAAINAKVDSKMADIPVIVNKQVKAIFTGKSK